MLGILECIDVPWDALRCGIESDHLGREIDEVDWVEAAAVVVKVAKECGGGDQVVERAWIFRSLYQISAMV